MTWSQEITQLVTEVDQLTAAVNVKKQALDDAANTAVNQRRRISSHTSRTSPVFTLASNWTVTPSTSAKFVIENDNDKIILKTSAVATTYNCNINGAQRFTKFDIKTRVLDRGSYLRFTQGTAIVGQKMAIGTFIDGSTKSSFVYTLNNTQAFMHSLVVQ